MNILDLNQRLSVQSMDNKMSVNETFGDMMTQFDELYSDAAPNAYEFQYVARMVVVGESSDEAPVLCCTQQLLFSLERSNDQHQDSLTILIVLLSL